jgi:ABC-2 type transport system permease protein
MSQQYNQWTAMWAITRAALRATFKSPQAVFFSLFFPIVLIMVFGALSGSRGISLDIAFEAQSDTSNLVYNAIKGSSVIKVKKGSENDLLDQLKKGRITALIDIRKLQDASGVVRYDLHIKTSSAGQNDLPALQAVLKDAISREIAKQFPDQAGTSSYINVSQEEVKGREYKMIDFYLPGMLGFSLIGAAVFGVSFLFFSLRETLVLKRMFATPVRKGYIVLGESIARVLFQLVMAVVLILFGTYFYEFTLAHGWITFMELLALCLLGLIVFIGFGFIISSVAKNQNVIPIYANLFMFPQYFLSGTFFSKTLLPAGMQKVVQFLPLTALNDAMRKVSFEGVHLNGVGKEILILLGWCVFAYGILIRIFKWE